MLIVLIGLIITRKYSDLDELLDRLVAEKYAQFGLGERLTVGSYKIYDLTDDEMVIIYCEVRGEVKVARFCEGMLVSQEIREYVPEPSSGISDAETRELG